MTDALFLATDKDFWEHLASNVLTEIVFSLPHAIFTYKLDKQMSSCEHPDVPLEQMSAPL